MYDHNISQYYIKTWVIRNGLRVNLLVFFVFSGFVFPPRDHKVLWPVACCSSYLVHIQTGSIFFFLVLSTSASVGPKSWLCRLTLPSILFSPLISVTNIHLLSIFRIHQHSNPYNSCTGVTNVSYSFSFVLTDILLLLHILLNLPNIADARPILRFISFEQWPSFVNKPPRHRNSIGAYSSRVIPVSHRVGKMNILKSQPECCLVEKCHQSQRLWPKNT